MIANIKSTEGVGNATIKKTIYAGAETIMFSVLQESQYMYPYKSAVREIVSNSIDSINERNTSLKILSGEIKVEDVYIVKEGDEFKDSSFNKDYYDPQWLSKDDNVYIEYIENATESRDMIRFIDHGVGLGSSRLINFFSLGYSSKRLSKSQVGGFGLGAKSLLATGVDFYTVTSNYNGKMFSFNIYKDHVVPVITKFNEDGSINPTTLLNSGIEGDEDVEVYYKVTDEMNGVIAEAEVKRHRKQDYINGIKNQLGFISNIVFTMKDGSYSNQVNIANKVLYEDEAVVVGERDYYAVPQILLTPGKGSRVRINYGPVNWDELEMKRYSGNVCFVMDINKVDVTPSRESVIWSQKTREAITDMFLAAQETVSKIVEKKVKSATNLVEHYHLFRSFKANASSDGVSELYKIVDLAEIESSFRGFTMAKAAKSLENAGIEKDFVFTSTPKTRYDDRVQDTIYNSNISKEYISELSTSSNAIIGVVVANTRYKNLARYVNSVVGIGYDDKVRIIFMKPAIYDEAIKKLENSTINKEVDKAFKKKEYDQVLLYETLRYANNNPSRLLLEADIDKTKMANMEKEEEEQYRQSRYMTEAERAKLEGKVIGNYHTSAKSTYRKYYNESILENESNPIIYVVNDSFAEGLFRDAPYDGGNDFNLIGFSADNFKRFYKLDNVTVLGDALYTIEFGILIFTPLGLSLLGHDMKTKIKYNYTFQKEKLDVSNTPYRFLNNCFATTAIEQSRHRQEVHEHTKKYKRRQSEYLDKNEDNK